MTSFRNELVLSLVQPYLKNPFDHLSSQRVSKYLHKTGSKDPNRPLPPLGWTLKNQRKKKDKFRLEKHCANIGAKEVYLESEIPIIHDALMKLGMYDILDVNVNIDYLKENQFFHQVECGVYIPVMYPRQTRPVWSMIFSGKKHKDIKDAKQFLKSIEFLKIYGVFHGGLSDVIIKTSKSLLQRDDIKDHPRYKQFLSEANSPCPFSCFYTTASYRWEDLHSTKKRVTFG